MLKVLYFRTYPPFSTSGHPHGRLATRMDTSVRDVHVHNTYIYINTISFLDIYIQGEVEVSEDSPVFPLVFSFWKPCGFLGEQPLKPA